MVKYFRGPEGVVRCVVVWCSIDQQNTSAQSHFSTMVDQSIEVVHLNDEAVLVLSNQGLVL
jgi:hypothetical protein